MPNFSERVRKILAVALQAAVDHQHAAVDTEHLLYALLKDGDGVATAVLQNLGNQRPVLEQRVAIFLSSRKQLTSRKGNPPYTAQAKRVLEHAIDEARQFGHDYVGTEHLLLGLLKQEQGFAARALRESALTHSLTRAETVRLLGTEVPRNSTADPDAGRIASVSMEVTLDNGSTIRHEVASVSDAIEYLKRQAHEAARRVEPD